MIKLKSLIDIAISSTNVAESFLLQHDRVQDKIFIHGIRTGVLNSCQK